MNNTVFNRKFLVFCTFATLTFHSTLVWYVYLNLIKISIQIVFLSYLINVGLIIFLNGGAFSSPNSINHEQKEQGKK